MKKIKYFIYLAALSMLTFSCQNALELAPQDYFGDGNFWQNEAQVSNFMVGLHKQFRDNQFQFLRLGEMRGGTYSNVDRQATSLNELPVIEQRLEETSSGVGSWAGFYGPILQINLFIQKVESIGFLPETKKSYLLGQAYAMRAYYYFHLLRTYGGVPLILQADVLNGTTDAVLLRKERSTEAQVLAAIKADVNKSVSLFGTQASTTDKSQWSPKAAYMLKGEVFLWSAIVYNTTADLAEAKAALTSAAGSVLLPSFANVFAYSQKNNNEIIFAIRYRVGESEMGNVAAYTYSTFNFNGLHYKDSTASAGVGNFLVDPLLLAATNSAQVIQRYAYTFELFQSYDLGDTRRNATFYDYYKVNTAVRPFVPTIKNTALVKFLGTIETNKRYFSDDWPVYREADRLLMLAEIVNAEGGDPSAYIQPVRDRAFAPGKDPKPFVNAGKDANELAIFTERTKEFVHEGKRWYDLRRMKYGAEPLVFKSASHPFGVLDKTTQAYRILWPIEAAIWTNDPLVKQTPGYTTARPN
ncbi:RagB/SusD family nutrient uptake outer membrane protein [Dyadobacter psychrotolerans]|uniref:RagB/SusD family nutrient uptake outer membrane protein n=1 Tax=Dyadobacter psychrotolerans TaxID=2541721 RepID=A0A4R5DRK5_9BACT|nr:RagB/SusD family nutrient uptake outer membrane protein [Dyadobacter psychrotolerans]TDE14691.1 RagB/SusD family nutrient uptake outer membrane protein [Dyadobacter psychrotolerans]